MVRIELTDSNPNKFTKWKQTRNNKVRQKKLFLTRDHQKWINWLKLVAQISPWPADTPMPKPVSTPWKTIQQTFSAAASITFSGLTKEQLKHPSAMLSIKQLHYDNIIQEKILSILTWIKSGYKNRNIRNLKPFLITSKLTKFWRLTFQQPMPPLTSAVELDHLIKQITDLRLSIRQSNQPQQILKTTYSQNQQTYNRLRTGSDFIRWQCNNRKLFTQEGSFL